MADLTDRHVLVLNRHWLAVHICTARRAISLLYQGLAQVVSDDFRTYNFDTWLMHSQTGEFNCNSMIRTPGFQFMVPSVIVLSRYQSCPPRTVRFNRRNIFLRDRHQCQYCGQNPGKDKLTIDHVIPRSRGGRSVWQNVVVACTHCNTKKGDRLPSECDMYPAVSPKRPSWLSALRVVPTHQEQNVWLRFIESASWEMMPSE
jgi:5-methylcytosine-specific restriction endonuclease McrA